MFLRSDDTEKWDALDKAISKKLGKTYIGLVKSKDMSKVQEIFTAKLDAIRKELTERIEPDMAILKDAASSAVKPREAGKKLKRNLSGIIKAEDTRSIRERLKDKAKEQVEQDNGTTEDEEPEVTPEEAPEVEDAKQPVAEEPLPEQGAMEPPVEQTQPTLEDNMAGGQAPSEQMPNIPLTPEEQAMEQAQVEELPDELGQLDGAIPGEPPVEEGLPGQEEIDPTMPNQGIPEEGMPPQEGRQPEEGMMPGEELPPEEGMPQEGQLPAEGMPEDGLTPEQAQNLQVNEPDPTLAQANDGRDQEKLLAIQDELGRLHSSLQEIQGLSQEQGLLTEEELENIIIPLLQETENLMENMKSDEDYRQSSLQQYGPENHVGDISRELTDQSTNFGRSSKTDSLSKKNIDKLRDGATKINKSDLKKGGPGSGRKPGGRLSQFIEGAKENTRQTNRAFKERGILGGIRESIETTPERYERSIGRLIKPKKVLKYNLLKGGEQGWHGDPEGHAEAARARWRGSGGASKDDISDLPKEGPLVVKPKKSPLVATAGKVAEVGGAVAREIGQDTTRALKRAGRGIADTAGDLLSDYGGEAVVAGMTAYLVASLKGEKKSLKQYLGDMKSEVLERIDEVKNWKVVRRLSRSNEAKVLRTLGQRARSVAGKAGATGAGRLSGKALRFAASAAKHNPRVAAALFVASAFGAEGARRVGAKVKQSKSSKKSKKTKK